MVMNPLNPCRTLQKNRFTKLLIIIIGSIILELLATERQVDSQAAVVGAGTKTPISSRI